MQELGKPDGKLDLLRLSVVQYGTRASFRRRVIDALQALPANAWMRHTGLAFAYIGSGDTTRALVELEAASRAREVTPFWAAFAGSMFDSVRHSARFAAIVRSFGLEPTTN